MKFVKSNTQPESDSHQSLPLPLPCSQCAGLTSKEDLSKYGTMCGGCFKSYCRNAPNYINTFDKYVGDPRGWAKRIMDRHAAGMHVNQTALKFAQEALG
jgi:hypothetical protein